MLKTMDDALSPFKTPQNVSLDHSPTITPDQLVGMILGADAVVLKGFGGVPAKLPFWVPVVDKFDVQMSAPASRKATEPFKLLFIPSIIFGVILLLGIAFWAGTIDRLGGMQAGLMGTWSAKSVERHGITLSVGGTLMAVPVGGLLPNGEFLRKVDAVRQTYSTDSQTVAVKQSGL